MSHQGAREECAPRRRDYPFDAQECALRLYTANPMNEVALNVYYNLRPSIMLSWGNETNRKHISGWSLEDVTANITYYRNREYNQSRPQNARQIAQTW